MKTIKFLFFLIFVISATILGCFYLFSLNIMNGYSPLIDTIKIEKSDSNKLEKIILKETKLNASFYNSKIEMIGPPRKVGVAVPKFSIWFDVFDKNKVPIKSGVAKFVVFEGEYELLGLVYKEDIPKKLKDKSLSRIFPEGVIIKIKNKI